MTMVSAKTSKWTGGGVTGQESDTRIASDGASFLRRQPPLTAASAQAAYTRLYGWYGRGMQGGVAAGTDDVAAAGGCGR